MLQAGITDVIDEEQLRQISSPPQREGVSWFKTPDFTQLHTILDTLVESSCSAPTPVPRKTRYPQKSVIHCACANSCAEPPL